MALFLKVVWGHEKSPSCQEGPSSCIYHTLLSHCSAFTESLLHADAMQIALHAHFILFHNSFQEESCIV